MTNSNKQNTFSNNVIQWQKSHGRNNLPWQTDRSPYRVWVSEIMLQQTQVATVIPYFIKFIDRFSDIESLALAHIDEVLFLWSGLGYYRRAKNLHKTSRVISRELSGIFPADLKQLIKLPGIGRSTAAAILSQAFQQPSAILDGNVKRVLSRYYAIQEPINLTKITNELWQKAEELLPNHNAIAYTQGLMDLGATVCLKQNPLCQDCPINQVCQARQQSLQNIIPLQEKKAEKPHKSADFVLLAIDHHILLKRKKKNGYWAELWCLPEVEELEKAKLNFILSLGPEWQNFRHTFSHFHLYCTIYQAVADKLISLPEGWLWYNFNMPPIIGMAKPMSNLLLEWQNLHSLNVALVAEPKKHYQ